MRYAVSLSASIALSAFWLILFYEMRKARFEDYEKIYNPWFDYLYTYGFVITSAATAVGISTKIGV